MTKAPTASALTQQDRSASVADTGEAATGPQPPDAQTLGGLLRYAADRWPNRPAIVCQGLTLNFCQTDEQVDAWARSLIALGVQRGDTVAVMSGNRKEWLLATFAAARVGALVAPMNTWYKQDELKYALRHSRAKILIAAAGLLKQDFTALITEIAPDLADPGRQAPDPALPDLLHWITFDESATSGAMPLPDFLAAGRTITAAQLQAMEDAVSGADPVFVLYTSGSTATPKGVLLQHRSTIVNNFHIGERQGLDGDDRAWLVIPLFYAFAAGNALAAVWTHGGALVLQEYFNADAALDLIERERATVYYGLGNMTRALLARQANHPRNIASLRKGLTGYSYEDKRLVIEELGVTECCSIYGQTESHGLVALTDAKDPVEVRLTSDGRALPGWELRVVDPQTELELPVNTVGHLLIRGLLTSGYLGDDALTAASFTDDRFFRTGDLVRIDTAGLLHFHSRLKEIIKTGGINVSPLDVESILEQHPCVSHAFVVGVPDAAQGEVTVAIVQRSPGRTVTAEEVKSFVKSRAAAFKVPVHVLFRQEGELPLLASGKIAKRALRDEVMAELSIETA